MFRPERRFSFLIYLGIALISALYIPLIFSRLINPFDIGHYEGFNLLPVSLLLEGKSPYGSAFAPPFSMAPYGALYYALLAPGLKIFGFQLWWGRSLSVIAFITCLWLVYLITKKITGNQTAALAALLAALAFFPAQAWIAIMRPDFIAAALALVCLKLVLDEEENKSTSNSKVFALVLIAASAFFVKQTTLLPAAIVAFRFLQINKLKTAVLFVFLFTAAMGLSIWGMNYHSSGGYLWQHLTHARDLPFSSNYLDVFLSGLLNKPTSLVFGICLLFFSVGKGLGFYNRERPGFSTIISSTEFLIFLYFFLSLGWAIVSSRRIGANINYYIENSFAAAVAFGIIYRHFQDRLGYKLILATTFFMIFGGAAQLARGLNGEYFRWKAYDYYQEISEKAAELTPPNSKCISVYPELVKNSGCDFYFDDFSEYVVGWSPELREIFEKEVESGCYATIVWLDDKLESEFPDYQLVSISQPSPERFYKPYLYTKASGARGNQCQEQ